MISETEVHGLQGYRGCPLQSLPQLSRKAVLSSPPYHLCVSSNCPKACLPTAVPQVGDAVGAPACLAGGRIGCLSVTVEVVHAQLWSCAFLCSLSMAIPAAGTATGGQLHPPHSPGLITLGVSR